MKERRRPQRERERSEAWPITGAARLSSVRAMIMASPKAVKAPKKVSSGTCGTRPRSGGGR
jgi:hypothetical protein